MKSEREPTVSLPGRVLIVDDNTELVATLQAVLARFSVTTASRGSEAAAIARSRGFDVAIVDVRLPDMSGVDLIRPLREVVPFAEVVLITGFATVDAAIGALRSGAFAFVLKSFRPEELIATVEQAITKVHLRRDREEIERKYRALVELTDVLVIAVDDENRAVLFDGRAFPEDWIPVEDRTRFYEAIGHAKTSDRAREVETGLIDTPNHPGKRVRWHLSGAREAGLVYGFGIDVTERRLLEKRAADAEALSAMGALALNLAHEIRNPLNAAVLQLNLLRRQVQKLEATDVVRSALTKRAEIVGDEIARLNRLLTEFLELARPRGIAREPVHVGGLVNDVLDLEAEGAKRLGIDIQRDVATDGCVAIGDREKLKQVAINIVMNAMEAMRNGGTLRASVRGEGDRVVLAIADTGPGISPENLASVFDPFFTTKEAGTGLGLSIVRKIVDQHGGEVRIESEGGAGTRVEVWLPTGRG